MATFQEQERWADKLLELKYSCTFVSFPSSQPFSVVEDVGI